MRRHTDTIVVYLSGQVEELSEWLESSRTVLEKPIPVLGEATFGDAKKLLGNYRVSCKCLALDLSAQFILYSFLGS